MAIACWSFGLYGHSVYLAELTKLYGWPPSVIAGASTATYLVQCRAGDLHRRRAKAFRCARVRAFRGLRRSCSRSSSWRSRASPGTSMWPISSWRSAGWDSGSYDPDHYQPVVRGEARAYHLARAQRRKLRRHCGRATARLRHCASRLHPHDVAGSLRDGRDHSSGGVDLGSARARSADTNRQHRTRVDAARRAAKACRSGPWRLPSRWRCSRSRSSYADRVHGTLVGLAQAASGIGHDRDGGNRPPHRRRLRGPVSMCGSSRAFDVQPGGSVVRDARSTDGRLLAACAIYGFSVGNIITLPR